MYTMNLVISIMLKISFKLQWHEGIQ